MNGTDNRLTTSSIKEILEAVQADREARKVFLSMPREEQLMAILGMIAYTNDQLAKLQKETIEYRQQRERREKKLTEILEETGPMKAMTPEEKQNTAQKIIALATRPARSGYLLDKVLSLILLILFYLVVTGRIP